MPPQTIYPGDDLFDAEAQEDIPTRIRLACDAKHIPFLPGEKSTYMVKGAGTCGKMGCWKIRRGQSRPFCELHACTDCFSRIKSRESEKCDNCRRTSFGRVAKKGQLYKANKARRERDYGT